MFAVANRPWFAILVSALGLSCGWAGASAQTHVAPPSGSGEPPIVISAPKPERPSDRELTKRVETALDAHPYLDASRITVTTENGVIHLEGLVADSWDLRIALRVANRAAGPRRVVDELDSYEPDGSGQ